MRLFLIFTAVLLVLATKSFANSCVTSSQQEEVQETKVITTDVPSHLKGAKIIVRLANGKESEVPAELFKVVPRKQERVITKVATNTTQVCKEFGLRKNRISALAGNGAKSGLDKSVKTDSVEVKSRTGFVGGLQYQRLLNDRISVGVQGQSNQSGFVSIGLDF